MGSPSPADYTATNEATARFTARNRGNQATSAPGIAPVIPLNRRTGSPRNIDPSTDCYAAPPAVTVPFGWRLDPAGTDGWLLRHDPVEWSIVSRLVSGKRAGRTYTGMAAEMAAEGAPLRNDSTRGPAQACGWYAERVRLIVLANAPELVGPKRFRPARIEGEPDPEFDSLLAEQAPEFRHLLPSFHGDRPVRRSRKSPQ